MMTSIMANNDDNFYLELAKKIYGKSFNLKKITKFEI